MRTRYYLVSLFIFSCYFYGAAQSRSRRKSKANTWELSTAVTQFHYSSLGQRSGAGLMADYYLSDKISVRGGLVFSDNYFKFSPAPIFWAALLNRPGHSHYHHSSSGRGALGYLLGLTMSDGFTYHVKLRKDLYFTPYMAPLQLQYYGPHGTINDAVAVSSLGLGFKGYIDKHWVWNVSGELSKSFLFKDGGYGYSFQASIGYVFKKR